MNVFNGKTENKGENETFIYRIKNKINNNYKCTVGIHGKTDELTKQKKKKKPTKTSKQKKKEMKKQSTNTGPTFLRLFRETAPFQSHGDTEDIF